MPTESDFESVAERRIREATERGEFDHLPGSGKPLQSLGRDYDPAWWAKRFVKRENARDRADELRSAIRAELPSLRIASDQSIAAARAVELNAMVDAVNEHLDPDDRVQPVIL